MGDGRYQLGRGYPTHLTGSRAWVLVQFLEAGVIILINSIGTVLRPAVATAGIAFMPACSTAAKEGFRRLGVKPLQREHSTGGAVTQPLEVPSLMHPPCRA